MRDLESGRATDPGLTSTRLARALCTDADLYGGHPCLSCQAAARQLVARAADQNLEPALVGAPRLIQPPPHGTSHKTARSYWATVLATVGR